MGDYFIRRNRYVQLLRPNTLFQIINVFILLLPRSQAIIFDMEKYIVTCDESTRKGANFSYFYGGIIVKEQRYSDISEKLKIYKEHIGLTHEMKRTHIDTTNANRYIDMLDFFFTFVKSGDIRVRIMFSDNNNLEAIPKEANQTFMKFYYLFVRHAFALPYAGTDIDLRLIFDVLPEKPENREIFKTYLINNLTHIPNEDAKNKIFLTRDRIEEVDSKKHIILQCADVIVGLIDFLLNDIHNNSRNKSKRWYAKNKVALVLWDYIQQLHPNFELQTSTRPMKGYYAWLDKYRHFVYKKTRDKKAPALPT